jgi:hypothetical protein
MPKKEISRGGTGRGCRGELGSGFGGWRGCRSREIRPPPPWSARTVALLLPELCVPHLHGRRRGCPVLAALRRCASCSGPRLPQVGPGHPGAGDGDALQVYDGGRSRPGARLPGSAHQRVLWPASAVSGAVGFIPARQCPAPELSHRAGGGRARPGSWLWLHAASPSTVVTPSAAAAVLPLGSLVGPGRPQISGIPRGGAGARRGCGQAGQAGIQLGSADCPDSFFPSCC